jgi:Bax protein
MQLTLLNNGKFWIIAAVIIILLGIILLSKKAEKSILLIDHITVEKIEDIKSVDDSLVAPTLYNEVKVLDELDSEIRKTKFIDVVLPTILILRHNLNEERAKVAQLRQQARYSQEWSSEDSTFMNELFDKYKTKNFDELVKRMMPPPISLALAQAAIESGWGSSRFFQQGNNIFGIWSFSKSDNRMVASQSRAGRNIYLKKYENLLESVADYHLILARGVQYKELRDCIQRNNNVFEMIWYLRNYSEKRDQYVVMLRNIIVSNDLVKYDNYSLDPEFFTYPSEQSADISMDLP